MIRAEILGMKKSIIWFLTIIMALTFAGLLYIQIMYMKNMVRMRDDQFAEGVKRSLYSVSNLLEQEEARYYLENDVESIESSALPAYPGAGSNLGGVRYSVTTTEGLSSDFTFTGELQHCRQCCRPRPRNSVIIPCRSRCAINMCISAAF